MPSSVPQLDSEWVMVKPASTPSSDTPYILTAEQTDTIHNMLRHWREDTWKLEWKKMFPGYAPCNLVPDEDLENITKNILDIHTVDDLQSLTHIVYWSIITPSLCEAIVAIKLAVVGKVDIELKDAEDEDEHIGGREP